MKLFLLKTTVFSILLVALSGCPHMIEKQVEQLQPPKDYKPIYTTTTIPFKKLLEQYKAPGDTSLKDSPVAGNSPQFTNETSPIRIEIRAVNDRNYPNEVELRAVVTDTAGRFIRGLAPPNFAGSGDWKNYWTSLYDSCSGTNLLIENF
ncbi:MAG: hypothetical protein V4642_03530, partial [Bacteroidota bacterium]